MTFRQILINMGQFYAQDRFGTFPEGQLEWADKYNIADNIVRLRSTTSGPWASCGLLLTSMQPKNLQNFVISTVYVVNIYN